MDYLHKYIFMSPYVALTALSIAPMYGQNSPKPNVVLVLTDDQGMGDLGCMGNTIIKTPNIDQFYQESVRLTNYHVSPTSAPSRSSLMTGRYADKVGVWHTIAGRSILFDREVLLPQLLADNGYTTGIFGKWHLGDNYPSRPQDRGFDESVVIGGGGITQGPDYWGNDYFSDSYKHNGKFEKYDGYCSDVFMDQALKFIEKNQDHPFFCYIPLNAAHEPYNVPAKYHSLYAKNDHLAKDQQRFYGMITNIDDNFALLRKKLKELNLEENTILIFMTDNGSAAGVRMKEGKICGYTAGLRGVKGSEYEGGHRVPCFISYPHDNIGGGKDLNELTAHIDMLPTLAELCGISTSSLPNKLDGRSLCPLLEETIDDEARYNWKSRILFVDSQRRQNLIKWRKSAVMTDRWRLVNGKELYDITQDLGEKEDVSAQYPNVVNRLREGYINWWDSLVADGANERYAYIKVGSEQENPVRISAHDMHTESVSAYNQYAVRVGSSSIGLFKVEVLTAGKYQIDLCRYPKESGLHFNSTVPAIQPSFELAKGMPAATNIDLKKAFLNIGQYSLKAPVDPSARYVRFDVDLEDGKYDLKTFFTDNLGRQNTVFYIYFTKL